VIDVKTAEVEPAELVARRIRRALEFVPAEKLVINPDCGLRHLPAEVARAKLRAMVAGAAQVRAELRPPAPRPAAARRAPAAGTVGPAPAAG
jgi:5-methyltetrahydropteroyltriglutamate--homocysteine methyltransferase